MKKDWELREYDRELFERELRSFVPEKIFDAHAHLYETWHWGSGERVLQGPKVATLAEYRRLMEWITPGSHTTALFFGAGFSDDRFRQANEFVAAEVSLDPECRGEMLVSPRMDPEEVRQEAKRLGFSGLKVYHTFVQGETTWHADISKFLTEDHVRVAHQEGWTITLHMVKDRAMADPANQQRIVEYCTRYPDMKLILAHAARGFNPYHTVEGIHALKGLRNVWCDTSAVTEAGAFEAIVDTLGHDRLLWGSDFPVSHGRGRCVAIGDQFVWLGEDSLDWDSVAAQAPIQPVLTGLESLRVLKLAVRHLRLSDSQVEDIFYVQRPKDAGDGGVRVSMGLRPRLHAEAAEATWPGRGLQPAGSASAPLRISLRLTARLLRLPLKGGVILERLVQAAMCKPNMVYTVPSNVGCPRRGCPVIPGLGAHKGRPYGYVQNDNSDQATHSPLEGESPLGARASRPHAVAYGGR